MHDPIRLMQGDCLTLLQGLPDGCIDLTVTSPPYDNMRTYFRSMPSLPFI